MMTRMVMMKMISSTNITSTRGVTLMSDIAWASSSPPPPVLSAMDLSLLSGSGGFDGGAGACRACGFIHAQSHLGARNQVGVQLVREMADPLLHALVATQKYVVTQHRGHRDRKADGRHDQRLADGSCHLVMEAWPATPMAIKAW